MGLRPGRLYDSIDGYRGVLVVVSHDLPFLEAIGITRWLQLDRKGLTAAATPSGTAGVSCPPRQRRHA